MADVEIIRKLGESATAIVHLAREPALKRLVAVKALRPELCSDAVAARRFEREAQSAARIAHPNVCSIHSVGRTPKGVPFIVMEHVEGRALDALMAAEGNLTTARVVALLSQIAAAIGAAHAKGVIHRDVRPANVLVEQASDRVVLTDFGIAAIHGSGTELVTRLTRLGERMGSVEYGSPEQRCGDEVTDATDVYSLGLVGIDLLNAGHRPVADAKPLYPDFPVALHRDVPRKLRDLLERCLAGDPGHRPAAASVADALAEMVADPDLLEDDDEEQDDTLIDFGLGFLGELKRRKVYRIAAAYAASAIVLIEVIDIVADALKIPDWLFNAIVAMLIGGFPIAVTLSWMFDLTKKGLERTRVEGASGPRHVMMFVVLPLLSLGLSISAAALVGWWILSD